MTERIVVGVDGSEGAADALRWAAREAEAHGAELTAVLAWGLLDQHHLDRDAPFDPHYDEDAARTALADIVGSVLGDRAAGVALRPISDLPARAVLAAAEGADLVVVGARGLGGFKELLLGSVSHSVLRGTTCPVAVVRGDRGGEPVRRIVVGVDGSDHAASALAWALDAARAHGATVQVVHAWQAAFATPIAPYDSSSVDRLEEAARAVLDHAVDAADTDGVEVERTLDLGSPGRVVLEAAADADLVVVGNRGRGGVGSLLLGSVSQQVVHHAPGPVVVVPG